MAKDWQRLSEFYENVFGCVPISPERHLSGRWIGKGTGVAGAQISGIHLALPGFEGPAPTLEIFQYSHNENKLTPAANREGYGHIAFEVDNVASALDAVLRHGGGILGEIVTQEVTGEGILTFVYAADPEGTSVELQSWE